MDTDHAQALIKTRLLFSGQREPSLVVGDAVASFGRETSLSGNVSTQYVDEGEELTLARMTVSPVNGNKQFAIGGNILFRRCVIYRYILLYIIWVIYCIRMIYNNR